MPELLRAQKRAYNSGRDGRSLRHVEYIPAITFEVNAQHDGSANETSGIILGRNVVAWFELVAGRADWIRTLDVEVAEETADKVGPFDIAFRFNLAAKLLHRVGNAAGKHEDASA